MQLHPTFERFQELARGAGLVPVWREFLFDVDTAVTAYAKLVEPPFGFLLESVVGGEQWARYSFLGTRPSGAWKLQRGVVSWWSPGAGWQEVATDDPLSSIAEDSGDRTISIASLIGNDDKGAANESGQTLTITWHSAHSCASDPASRSPCCAARAAVAVLRPSEAHSTSRPLRRAEAAIEIPISPGWTMPSRCNCVICVSLW